jgi:hypothetical protein
MNTAARSKHVNQTFKKIALGHSNEELACCLSSKYDLFYSLLKYKKMNRLSHSFLGARFKASP